MKIHEILSENIFTCDYHKVMEAVAALYAEHYDINIWDNAKGHDEAAKVLMKVHPTEEELDYILDTHQLPERFVELDFPLNDEIMYGIQGDDTVKESQEQSAQVANIKAMIKQLERMQAQGLEATDKYQTLKNKMVLAVKNLPMGEAIVDETPASRKLCKSGKPDAALGASQLASCKSQGYRSRDGAKSHKVGRERVKVGGKKIKGKKYGGPLPDWS